MQNYRSRVAPVADYQLQVLQVPLHRNASSVIQSHLQVPFISTLVKTYVHTNSRMESCCGWVLIIRMGARIYEC